MGFWIFMTCMNLLIPLLMVVFGVVFLRRPPRKINGAYGYRTARSMASQQAWDFAHAYFGRLWTRMGLVMLPLSVLAMVPCIGKSDNVIGIWGGVLSALECVVMIVPIVPTEKALKRLF